MHGTDLVSTGIVEHRWQVGLFHVRAKKINAEKVKNAVATLFGFNRQVAYAL